MEDENVMTKILQRKDIYDRVILHHLGGKDFGAYVYHLVRQIFSSTAYGRISVLEYFHWCRLTKNHDESEATQKNYKRATYEETKSNRV